jgi:hypothetical protein
MNGTDNPPWVAHEQDLATLDGLSELLPNRVSYTRRDLAEHLTAPGRHSVSYARGAGRSNTLTIVVR